MTHLIEYERPDGKTVSGYLAEPDHAERAPGVVVIQEWWGLNDQIRGVAHKLARAGYRALVPDLYRGKVTVEAEEAEHLMKGLDFGDAATEDVRGAVQYLKAKTRKVGVIGFCMGGALTILSAVNVPEVDVAVCFYGYPPLEYVDATKIKIPLLGHFAVEDAFFPISGVGELETKLRAAGVRFDFQRYQARHAFANETAVNATIPIAYNEIAAELAWERTLAFLKTELG